MQMAQDFQRNQKQIKTKNKNPQSREVFSELCKLRCKTLLKFYICLISLDHFLITFFISLNSRDLRLHLGYCVIEKLEDTQPS